MRVCFNLKTPKEKESRIVLVVYLGEKLPLRYSTGLKIPTKFWNSSLQKLRVVKEYPQAKKVNDVLDSLLVLCKEYSRENPVPDSKSLKSYLDIKTGRTREVKDTLIALFEEYNKIGRDKSNIKSYNSTLAALKEFEDSPIDQVGLDYLERFKEHYLKTKIKRYKYKDRHPTINYFFVHVKNIKAVVNYYRKKGYDYDISIKDFKKVFIEVDSIYLNTEEIEAMADLPIKGVAEKARDLFIIGCYTALRVSDYTYLKKENIRNGKIYISSKKTDERSVIPLHPRVKQILEKYNYQLPSVSDVLINRHIKSVACKVGIDEEIEVIRHEGIKKVSYTKKKWELVTSHTARRSGATNMYLAGIPSISIMMITGHRTEKSFLRYIKVTKEQNADLLAKHPFFT